MTTPSLSLDFPRVASHVHLYGQLATLIDENLPLAESAPDVGNVFVLGQGPHQPGDKWKFFHSFYRGQKQRTFWTPLMAAGHGWNDVRLCAIYARHLALEIGKTESVVLTIFQRPAQNHEVICPVPRWWGQSKHGKPGG
jgi:hypothetical protein